jgi:hypothetical protein
MTIGGGAERFSTEDKLSHVLSLALSSFICSTIYLAQPPTFLVYRRWEGFMSRKLKRVSEKDMSKLVNGRTSAKVGADCP